MPPRVLLVDDEPELVQTLAERLRMRNVDTAVALSGEEALSSLKHDEPEVMILDLRMPGMDGIEVLRRTKKDHPTVEVIILTAHGTERDAALTRELGAYAYLEKPMEIGHLMKVVQAAREQAGRQKAGRHGEDD
jgi:DNA-binding response OmpR family regulator